MAGERIPLLSVKKMFIPTFPPKTKKNNGSPIFPSRKYKKIDTKVEKALLEHRKSISNLDVDKRNIQAPQDMKLDPSIKKNQNVILRKLDDYLKLKQRQLRVGMSGGYCYGLTLLWLYKMAEGKEKWFYTAIDKIISSGDEKLLENEIEIEKFISHIEWCQNSYVYVFEDKFSGNNQRDIAKTLQAKSILQTNVTYNELELTHFLFKLPENNILVILSLTSKHAIGFFKRQDHYYLYDPNYESGRPIVVEHPSELIPSIKKSLYTHFNIDIPRQFDLGLDVGLVPQLPVLKLNRSFQLFAPKGKKKLLDLTEDKLLGRDFKIPTL